MLLALLMALTAIAFVAPKAELVAEAATNGYYSWSGYSTYLKGAGTAKNPFLISTPGDLAYFRRQVADASGKITYYANNNTSSTAKTLTASTAYYKLANDIYYNDPNGDEWKTWSDTVTPTNGGEGAHTWKPAGCDDVATRNFEGSFDGDNHTIYGMYIVQAQYNGVGFIGAMRYGTIKNLNLANGYVQGNHQVGAFVGHARWGTELVNCTSNMRVVGDNAVGGIVGGNAKNGTYINTDVDINSESTISSITVYNCVNNGNVRGAKWVGGIMGYISAGASRVQIEECVNNGNISVTNQCVGGVLGGVREADGAGHNVIDTCINNGNVTGATGGNSAGIVGCARAVDIYYCKNYGTVKSNGNTVGGITGGGNPLDNLCNSKISSCYNAGKISGTYCVGGITGSGKGFDVNSCANVGSVTGTYDVGGILGRARGTADLRNSEVCDCYNAGNVVSSTSDATVAGIVGNIYCDVSSNVNYYAMVKRCVNIGSVTGGRAISATASTVKDNSGKGLFVLTQFNDTCFGLSNVNTNFDGGTEVSSLVSPEVLEILGSAWEASYPLPTLKDLDYSVQNYGNRADMLTVSNVSVSSTPALDVDVTLDTSKFYTEISSKALTFGVLASKTDDLAGELKHKTKGVIEAVGALSDTGYTATISGQNADSYDDMYAVRPFVSFEENGQTVYIYGKATETSYYTASGAQNVPAVNETATFTCDEKLYILVGGSDKIECKIGSASDKDSITFISSDTSVATVSEGVVKGIKAGTATVTVTYTGAWGAVTRHCTVTVLDDLTSNSYANKYAEQDGNLRIHTNKLKRALSITKNDGTALDYNGTVFLVDSGDNNDESTKYLLKLREEYLADGLASGALTEAEYYRHLLSDKCQLQVVLLLTHWHTDHINSARFHISAEPKISVHKLYTMADPANTKADGHANYIKVFDETVTKLKVNNPDLVATQFAYETEKVRYFSGNSQLSTTDTSYPIKLTVCTSRDWSKNANLCVDRTEWENSSSTWFVFEFAGQKLLFTGDTYIADTGSKYTGASTSGNTAVDFMLYKHKGIVDTSVDFMDCNHHGRSAYNENLFTATKPSIVIATVYYGNDSVPLVSKAVSYGDVYLAGDQEQVFVIDSNGVFDNSGAFVSYKKNTSGHAVRNRITLKQARGYGEATTTSTPLTAPTGVTLSSESLVVPVGATVWLAPTVAGDSTTNKNVTWTVSDSAVVTTDGAYITAHKLGSATVEVKAGSHTATCDVTVVPELSDVATSNADVDGFDVGFTLTGAEDTTSVKVIAYPDGQSEASSSAKSYGYNYTDADFATITKVEGENRYTFRVDIANHENIAGGYTLAFYYSDNGNDLNISTNASVATVPLLGDSNRDGAVDVRDATLIQKYAVGLEAFDEEQIILADYYRDVRINIKDATAIQRYIARLTVD